jgi:SAM-dependent methyltransferase
MDSPYVRGAPSAQQTLDVFAGKWASQLPGPFSGLKAGYAPLFEDPRIEWAREKFSEFGVPIEGASILELGPLEGGHTYMLSRMGAAAVTAVEAHREAYLKCLVAKELLGVERVNFLLGDAVEYLRQGSNVFDIGFASGFLYHLHDPVALIEMLCRRTRAVFVWSNCWSEDFARRHSDGAAGGQGLVTRQVHGGFSHTLHRHDYGSGFSFSQFWGGSKEYANWMEKDDILGAFSHFGFTRQASLDGENEWGATLQLAAVRE